MRARGGEAGRRLVTQQNARAWPPRLRTLCFQAPARLSRDLYGKGGVSQLLRDSSLARPLARPLALPPALSLSLPPASGVLARSPFRAPRPLAANRLSTRPGRSPRETARLPREAAAETRPRGDTSPGRCVGGRV